MKQKRILIYRPNDRMITEENGTSNYNDLPRLPYSLAQVSATLRNKNYFINFYDAFAQNDKIEKAKKTILIYNPEILIVQTNVLACDLSLKAIGEIKKITDPKIISLINADFEREILERFPFLDFVVRHEWAEATGDIVDFLHGKIQKIEKIGGVFYRDNKGKILKNPKREHLDINKRPLPAFDLLPMRHYPVYSMEASVGCPHHCLFCPFGRYPESGWEGKDIERVILEMKEMLRYGKKPFFFVDNELTASRDWCKRLVIRIIEEKLDIEADINIRASSVDEGLIKLLDRAGITKLGMGAESGVQAILDRNQKDLTLKQIREAFVLTRKYGLAVKTYFLIGLLGDTKETIKETYRFTTEDLRAYQSSFDIVIPFPDTPMYNLLKQKGWLKELTIDNLIWIYKNLYHYPNLKNLPGKKPNWRTENLTFDDLLELFFEYYQKVEKSSTRILVKKRLKEGKLLKKLVRLGLKSPRKFWKLTKDFVFPKKTKF